MRALQVLFGAILVSMVAVTARATWDRGVFEAGRALWPDWWFKATLADAYFGFLTVYLWVWYRERAWQGRAVWALAFAALGNIAIAVYVLRAIARLPRNASIETLLVRPR